MVVVGLAIKIRYNSKVELTKFNDKLSNVCEREKKEFRMFTSVMA